MKRSPFAHASATKSGPGRWVAGSTTSWIQKHPSFVYETVRLVKHPQLSIEVRVRPRAGTRATCSQCRRRGPGYDTQAVRRFDFVPLWHIPVVFVNGHSKFPHLRSPKIPPPLVYKAMR